MSKEGEGVGATQDAYAAHLAAVNEKQPVHATSDVYSVHGVLVAKKGSAIDYEMARKIVRHKLVMPLDKSIELSHTLTAKALHRRLGPILEKFSDLRTAHTNLEFASHFERLATRVELPPLIAQKLTVMGVRQPALMDQTLLGAWMACLIGRSLELHEKELTLVYVAAVSRDVGMLHIDPSVLARPHDDVVEPHEFLTLQSHVVASSMILQECEGIPDRVPAAVLQHHENYDGTGYPSNYRGTELGLMGQILSVADTLVAIRFHRFAGSGRNLRDTLAILHIDADAYHPDVGTAAVRILHKSGVQPTTFHPFESREALLQTLSRRARAMVSCRGMLEDMPNLIPVDNRKLTPVVLTTFLERLNQTLARSGLADIEVVRWLGQVQEGREEASLRDLTELDLQQRELLWQFRRLQMNIVRFADKERMRARNPIRLMVERMGSFFEQLDADPDMFLEEVRASGSPEPEAGLAYGEDFVGS